MRAIVFIFAAYLFALKQQGAYASSSWYYGKDNKVSVSTEIVLRVEPVESTINDSSYYEMFNLLLEKCLWQELMPFEALKSSSVYKISSVRSRLIEQTTQQLERSDGGSKNDQNDMSLSIKLAMTGEYEHIPATSNHDSQQSLEESIPPTSQDFRDAIKFFFDHGGSKVFIKKYLRTIEKPQGLLDFVAELEKVEFVTPRQAQEEDEIEIVTQQQQEEEGTGGSGGGGPTLLLFGIVLGVVAIFIGVIGILIVDMRKRHNKALISNDSSSFIGKDGSSSSRVAEEARLVADSSWDLESGGGSVYSNMYSSSNNNHSSNILPPMRLETEGTERCDDTEDDDSEDLLNSPTERMNDVSKDIIPEIREGFVDEDDPVTVDAVAPSTSNVGGVDLSTSSQSKTDNAAKIEDDNIKGVTKPSNANDEREATIDGKKASEAIVDNTKEEAEAQTSPKVNDDDERELLACSGAEISTTEEDGIEATEVVLVDNEEESKAPTLPEANDAEQVRDGKEKTVEGPEDGKKQESLANRFLNTCSVAESDTDDQSIAASTTKATSTAAAAAVVVENEIESEGDDGKDETPTDEEEAKVMQSLTDGKEEEMSVNKDEALDVEEEKSSSCKTEVSQDDSDSKKAIKPEEESEETKSLASGDEIDREENEGDDQTPSDGQCNDEIEDETLEAEGGSSEDCKSIEHENEKPSSSTWAGDDENEGGDRDVVSSNDEDTVEVVEDEEPNLFGDGAVGTDQDQGGHTHDEERAAREQLKLYLEKLSKQSDEAPSSSKEKSSQQGKIESDPKEEHGLVDDASLDASLDDFDGFLEENKEEAVIQINDLYHSIRERNTGPVDCDASHSTSSTKQKGCSGPVDVDAMSQDDSQSSPVSAAPRDDMDARSSTGQSDISGKMSVSSEISCGSGSSSAKSLASQEPSLLRNLGVIGSSTEPTKTPSLIPTAVVSSTNPKKENVNATDETEEASIALAPPGRLGLALQLVDGRIIVVTVKETSPLYSLITEGDEIVAVDDTVTTNAISAANVIELLKRQEHTERKISYIKRQGVEC